MMNEEEIRQWRKQEQDRLSCFVMPRAKEQCKIVINTLNEVLRDKK